MCNGLGLDESAEVDSLNKLFDFVFQCLTSFGHMVVVAMILTAFRGIGILWSL